MSISIEDVWDAFEQMCKLDQSQKQDNIVYCGIAVSEFEGQVVEDPSEKAIVAAAILAVYYYCLLNDITDSGDISFEAGDVSVKYTPSGDIEKLRKLAYEFAAQDLVTGSDFSFKAV